jgi:hypothetical protein
MSVISTIRGLHDMSLADAVVPMTPLNSRADLAEAGAAATPPSPQ